MSFDMFAVPQNAKPIGEWNTSSIMVYKGRLYMDKIARMFLNITCDPTVDKYVQASKFSQDKWPLAFELLNNAGGADREGYIGLQDHGMTWFRTLR